MHALWVMLVVLTLVCGTPTATHTPVIETDCGKVQGTYFVEQQTGVNLSWFKDIPFGNISQRWQPPVPSTCWSGIRDTTKRRGICWQRNGHTRPPSIFSQQREDCLTLDVVVSSKHVRGDATLPVIVWLYGVRESYEHYQYVSKVLSLALLKVCLGVGWLILIVLDYVYFQQSSSLTYMTNSSSVQYALVSVMVYLRCEICHV